MKDKDFGSRVLAPQIVNVLASWYRGLEIVLPYLWENNMHDLVEELWQTAVWRSDLNCLLIISQHLRHVTCEHWETLNRWNRFDPFLPREKWKRIFQVMGEKLLTKEETKYGLPTKTNTYTQRDLMSSTPLLYHTKFLGVEAASCAWSLGHRRLEDERRIENETSRSGTALWINSSQGRLETTIWLLKHGADPTWVHPILLTMPAHIIARRVFSGNAWSLPEDQEATIDLHNILFENGLLTLDLQDRCVCSCSKTGCHPISSAIGALTRACPFFRNGLYCLKPPLFSFSDVFPLVNLATDQDWIASSILRTMTFEGLLITHTCCHEAYGRIDIWGFLGFLSRSTPEEIAMIHKDEQTQIECLEGLVAGFEADWDAYEGSFESFIWKVWRPRMQAVRRGDGDEDEHVAELFKIGFQLAASDTKDDVDNDITWMEYFLFGKEVEDEGEEDGRHYWTISIRRTGSSLF
jgi:hypothetical protein